MKSGWILPTVVLHAAMLRHEAKGQDIRDSFWMIPYRGGYPERSPIILTVTIPALQVILHVFGASDVLEQMRIAEDVHC
jgi:hypothetical protein